MNFEETHMYYGLKGVFGFADVESSFKAAGNESPATADLGLPRSAPKKATADLLQTTRARCGLLLAAAKGRCGKACRI